MTSNFDQFLLSNLKCGLYSVSLLLIAYLLCSCRNKNETSSEIEYFPSQVASLDLRKEYILAKSNLYDLYALTKLGDNSKCLNKHSPLDIDIKLDTVYLDTIFNSYQFYFDIYSQFDVNALILCGKIGIHSVWVDNQNELEPKISHWGFDDYVVFEFEEFSDEQSRQIQSYYTQNIDGLTDWIKRYNMNTELGDNQ